MFSECGLFIDTKNHFLGATPDGLIGNDTLVEIKCPISAANITTEEGIRQRKITLWKINKDKDIIGINTHHKYLLLPNPRTVACDMPNIWNDSVLDKKKE